MKRLCTWVTILGVSAGMTGALSAEELLVKWDFNEVVDGGFADLAGKTPATIRGEGGGDILQPGLYGKAFLVTPGERWLEVPSSDLVNLKEDFTVHCVFKPIHVHSYRTILRKGNWKQVNYLLGMRDGRVEFKYKDAEGKWVTITAQRNIKENEWVDVRAYHSDGAMEIWINGRKQPTVKWRAGEGDEAMVENEEPALVGVSAGDTGRYDYWFYGLIDELAIYRGRFVETNLAAEMAARTQEYEEAMAAIEEQRKRAEAVAAWERDKAFEQFYAASGASTPFILRVLPTARRLEKRPDAVKVLSELSSQKVELSAAGNEVESVQLLVVAGPKVGIKEATLQLSPLVNDDGAVFPVKQMEWGPIQSVTTERPGIAVDFVGEIPDVVRYGTHSFAVEAGDFTPVMIRYSVPEGTAPGVYRGKVAVEAGGAKSEVEVALRVAEFSLPKKGSLKVAFSFFESTYEKWYGRTSLTKAEKLAIYDFLLSYRIPPSNLYHSERESYPSFELLEAIKDRTNFFTIRSWGSKLVAEKEEVERRVVNYRTMLEKVDALGLKDEVYFYGVDELWWHMDKNLPAAKQAHEVLSVAFPDLRMMQTSNPIPELRDLYNVWIPLVEYFDQPETRKEFDGLKKSGQEVWWYLADTPLRPYPNFFLDYPVFDSRIYGVLSWMYGVDGLLYWAMNREWRTNMDIRRQWPEAAWRPYILHVHQGTRKSRNGMGNLIYPGPKGQIYPSLRLENLRDGLEDYEYLALLKRRISEREKAGEAEQPEVRKARKLLSVPQQVAKAANDYNADPTELAAYRKALTEAIERLKK